MAVSVLAALTIASCGSEHKQPTTSTTTTTPATAPASTSRAHTTSTTAPKSGASHTAAPAATSSSPAASAPSSPSGQVATGRSYTGRGNRAIGTITLRSPVTLTWSTTKPKIQVFTSLGFVLVNSHKTTGSIKLSKGTYRGVRVASPGTWTVLLRPLG